MNYTYHIDGTHPSEDEVFVFGSNEAGRHGAGAARAAAEFYGAKEGGGEGHYGRSYAIPTKDMQIRTLPLDGIKVSVDAFLRYARMTTNTQRFFMTRIGCGLAGYTDEQIAPMFKGAPTNINFPEEWKPYLED